MLDVYKKLEAKGVIGPVDVQGRLRPFQEYPKMIRVGDTAAAGGRQLHGPPGSHKVIVHSQREELALLSELPADVAIGDPVVEEKNRLAAENARQSDEIARLREELARIAGSPAVASAIIGEPVKEPKVTPKVPTVPRTDHPFPRKSAEAT